MAPTGRTFKDVQTWALRDFPNQFKYLPDALAFHVQFNVVRGYNHDNSFKSLVIGSTHTKTGRPVDVLAWLAGTRIQIAYIGKNRKGEPQIRHMVFAEENVSWWKFKFPFSIILPTQGETGVACFNAMLRYYFLAKGWTKGVIDDSDVFYRFVSRFPFACQAIANAVTQRPVPVLTSNVTAPPQEASRVPIASANYQSPYPMRAPYLFEQIANDPLPSSSYTVLSSPSPSPPPTEGPVTPQVLRSPLELQTQFGCPQPDSLGGDQMAELDESNNAGERDSPGLRNKLFDLNIQLMIAEGRARDAETVAQKAQVESQLWKKRYEEAESYRIKYEEIRSHFGLQEQDERRA
ncbi:hypothetical protein J4E80_003598 [Alternaria sp. BMP 0032]|nr:hypothetical protein J4E80_003598 [Alternaria sp. BMP 0032]